MAASVFSRLYRKVMASTLGPVGFQRKGSVFWRERDGVLHIISLDRSPFDGQFTVDVAVQPLLFPFDTFDLSLGARLARLGSGIPHRWEVPTEMAEMEQVLERFAQKVVEFAIPWLDRFQSTRDIVEIDARDTWGVFPLLRSARTEIVGLCALDAGEFDRARELLSRAFAESYSDLEEKSRQSGIDAPQWARERRQMIQELLDLLESGKWEEIGRRLEEYKMYTRTALGIG